MPQALADAAGDGLRLALDAEVLEDLVLDLVVKQGGAHLRSSAKTRPEKSVTPTRRAVTRSGSRLRLVALRVLAALCTSYCSSMTGARQVFEVVNEERDIVAGRQNTDGDQPV